MWGVVVAALLFGLRACADDEVPITPTIPLPERVTTPTNVPTDPGFPVAVEDPVGNMVRLASAPQRIISLSPAHTEILYALGLGERVVGVTIYCDYPPEVGAKPEVGAYTTVDLAKVMEGFRVIQLRQKGGNAMHPKQLTPEQLKDAPQQAIISGFRKYAK